MAKLYCKEHAFQPHIFQHSFGGRDEVLKKVLLSRGRARAALVWEVQGVAVHLLAEMARLQGSERVSVDQTEWLERAVDIYFKVTNGSW